MFTLISTEMTIQTARSFILSGFFCLIAGAAIAQEVREITLPPYHWAQQYFHELRLRAPAQFSFTGSYPITLRQLHQATENSAGQAMAAKRFVPTLRAYLRSYNPYPEEKSEPFFQLGTLSSGRAGQIEGETKTRLSQRLALGLSFSSAFQIHSVVNLDEGLRDDPHYTGKKWRGFAAITEQGYGLYSRNNFLLKFGRDYIRWGRGEDAALLISDASLPFDHFQLQLRTKHAQFTYFSAKLNGVLLPDTTVQPGPVIERYLSGGRAEFALFHRRLQIAVSQSVLYARQGGFEWYYLNPFLVYHGEVVNKPGGANSFGSIDFSAYPKPGLELYGELLIDDFQIEKTSVVDLEPAEYGYILGLRAADLMQWQGTTLGLEYTRVKNRTYNTMIPAEQYTHLTRPIGHFMGNDFDRWLLWGKLYLENGLQIGARAEVWRRGEGRIDGPFDTPWLFVTLEEGYSEPFPTGVVEKSVQLTAQLRWQLSSMSYIEARVMHRTARNDDNRAGIDFKRTEFFLHFWLEWNKFWKI